MTTQLTSKKVIEREQQQKQQQLICTKGCSHAYKNREDTSRCCCVSPNIIAQKQFHVESTKWERNMRYCQGIKLYDNTNIAINRSIFAAM